MKILAIWITKGLFIFVICIAEWNVCSNLIWCPKRLASISAGYTYTLTDNRVYLVINSHINFGSALYLICYYNSSYEPKINYLGGYNNCLSFTFNKNTMDIGLKDSSFVRATVIEIGITS